MFSVFHHRFDLWLGSWDGRTTDDREGLRGISHVWRWHEGFSSMLASFCRTQQELGDHLFNGFSLEVDDGHMHRALVMWQRLADPYVAHPFWSRIAASAHHWLVFLSNPSFLLCY